MKFFFTISLFVFSFSVAMAQEKLGVASSNTYPDSSIFLNPSSSSDSRAFIQFNLVGANAYAFTNQGYLPKFRAIPLFLLNTMLI